MRRDASSPAAYRRDVSGDQRRLLEAVRLTNLGAPKHYVARRHRCRQVAH